MIRLRSFFARGSRVVFAGTLVALACMALVLTHSAPAADHMGDGGDEMAVAISMCLGVVFGVAALLGRTGGVLRSPQRRPPARLHAVGLRERAPGMLAGPASARAGPAALQVFLR